MIKQVKNTSDILVHSTLGSQTKGLPIRERLQPVLSLAKSPASKPDILPICLSSPNWDFYDPKERRFLGAEKVYSNPTDEMITSAQELNAAGVAVSCVSWDIGATRRLDALRHAGILNDPVYMQFDLTSGNMLAGHPATAEGLDAHLAFLPQGAAIEWGVINLHGSILPLAEKIILAGGHIHIGIGDHHYEEEGVPTNAELVRRIVDIAHRLGREIASPKEARSMLGIAP